MKNIGLVLEGGGTRGVYSTDVDEIIRPSQNINASMIEHDIDKSNKCYEIGWLQGIDEIQKVKDFLEV